MGYLQKVLQRVLSDNKDGHSIMDECTNFENYPPFFGEHVCFTHEHFFKRLWYTVSTN